MKKIINTLVNIFLVICFLVILLSILGTKNNAFLGLERGIWREIHEVGGYFFIVLGIIHFVLHWWWVRLTFFSRKK